MAAHQAPVLLCKNSRIQKGAHRSWVVKGVDCATYCFFPLGFKSTLYTCLLCTNGSGPFKYFFPLPASPEFWPVELERHYKEENGFCLLALGCSLCRVLQHAHLSPALGAWSTHTPSSAWLLPCMVATSTEASWSLESPISQSCSSLLLLVCFCLWNTHTASLVLATNTLDNQQCPVASNSPHHLPPPTLPPVAL